MIAMMGKAKEAEASSKQFRSMMEQGEFALLAAILEQARMDIDYGYRDYLKKNTNGEESQRKLSAIKARVWISEDPVRPYGEWSFPWVCEYLGLDALKVRQAILDSVAAKHNGGKSKCKKQSSR